MRLDMDRLGLRLDLGPIQLQQKQELILDCITAHPEVASTDTGGIAGHL